MDTWEYQVRYCDFCSEETLPPQLETVRADVALRIVNADGSIMDLNRLWNACEFCLPLLTTGKWKELATRVNSVDADHTPVRELLMYWAQSFR